MQHLLSRDASATGSAKANAVTRLLLWPTAALLAGQWLLFPVAVAGAAGYDTTYGLASLVLPVLYFAPLAMTRRWETSLRLAFTAGLVLSAFSVVFAFAPHTGMNPVGGPLALRYLPRALVVAAIGTLAYVSGHRMGAIGDGDPPRTDHLRGD